MINKKLAALLISEGLKTGADFVELYIEHSKSNTITYDNGIVEAIGNTVSCGVGVRLLKENRSIYGYTNGYNKKDLLTLVTRLRDAFKGEQIVQLKEFKTLRVKNNSLIEDSYFDCPTEDKIKILDKIHTVIKATSPLIVRDIARFVADHTDVELYNSNGLHFTDAKERIRLVAHAIASDGKKMDDGYSGPGVSAGMKFYKELDLDAFAKEVAEDAVSSLNAVDCPSGKMPVIIGNGFGGVLFHEACGHPLEASSVSRNLSVFSNRLGTQIASPLVTAYDDGTIPNEWGSNNIDDEGNKTQKTCLIKDGILMSYLVDNFSGRRMNTPGNGACRRESYKLEPTSRMSNTYIANGNSTVEEILANTKLGLYAKKLGGGSVNPITGEFEFAVSQGYIVRDGKICEQVRGATLIGKGEEILKNIDMVGNDLKLAQGVCGASSGQVPVDVGQPTIRVKEILVGGNGEKIK